MLKHIFSRSHFGHLDSPETINISFFNSYSSILDKIYIIFRNYADFKIQIFPKIRETEFATPIRFGIFCPKLTNFDLPENHKKSFKSF